MVEPEFQMGGGGHSDPEVTGGAVSKTFFFGPLDLGLV